MTISGVVSGTDLNKEGSSTLTLLAPNTFTGVLNVNAGTVTLSNTNTYTGATTIGGSSIGGAYVVGNLTLTLYGTATGSSGFTINGTGAATVATNNALTIDNTQFNNTNRIGDTATIALNGGFLNFQAFNAANTASSETVGAITLVSGQSTIQSGYTATPVLGATSVLTSPNLIRTVTGATVNFIGNNEALGTAANQLVFSQINGAAPASSLVGNGGGIVPWAEVNGASGTGDFATYGGNGVVAFSNYVTTIAAAVPGDIVKITVGETVASNKSIGALLVSNAIATFSPGVTLNLSTGAVMGSGTTTQSQLGITFTAFGTNQGTLDFGASEGIVFSNNSVNNLNFDCNITGSGGVTISGVNGTYLSTPANTYTGGTTVNSGTLVVGGNGNFGTGAVTLNGGTIQANNINVTYGNTINLNGPVTFTSSNTMTLSGTIKLNANNAVTVNTTPVIVTGTLAGSSPLLMAGGNNVLSFSATAAPTRRMSLSRAAP